MGVTYKLKDEIVEFIIRQKRENPQISCRKLVIAVHAEYGLNVSKSSINAVIKEANLSSPVGRTPADLNQSKKFNIPKEKKVQLFGDGFPALDKTLQQEPNLIRNNPNESPKRIADKKKPVSDPPVQSVEAPASILSQVIEIIPTSGNEPSKILNPESIESPEVDTRAVLQGDVIGGADTSSEEKFEIKDMRSLLMRMSYWEFFPKPIFEEFFKRHTSLGEEEIRMVDVLACFSPGIFDNLSAALDLQNIWLWKMSGWDSMPAKEEIECIMRFLSTTKIPKFDYLLELGYFCSMVSCVKWILSNGQEIFVDGRYMSVDSAKDKTFPFCPIERAVEETTRFIDGQEVLVLRCLSQEHLKDDFLKLRSSLFVHHENPVKKAVLMGMQGDQLLEFDHIPGKPRHFILSTGMSKGQFNDLFGIPLEFIPGQTLGTPDEQFNFADRVVEISKITNEQEIRIPVRMVIFDLSESGDLEVCMTSIPQSTLSTKELAVRIFRFQQGQTTKGDFDGAKYVFTGDDSEITIAQALTSLSRMVEEAMSATFAQFGKTDNYFTSICQSSGYIIFGNRSIHIHFQLSEKVEYSLIRDFSNDISVYKSITYDGKKISQI